MRKILAALIAVMAVVLFVGQAFAGSVRGYYRSNGTYVQPHYRSNPNSTVRDNYGYRGNSNPYTGKTGTNYYRSSPSSGYYTPSYKFGY